MKVYTVFGDVWHETLLHNILIGLIVYIDIDSSPDGSEIIIQRQPK